MTPPRERGKLKVFLGYAAGVGKTYQMLDEAQQLQLAGVDVVIGYFEPHSRVDTIRKAEPLESVPRRVIQYRGTAFEEMDTAAILLRNPNVCLVDEFPHTNVPGSERLKRWEDVQAILDQGIHVHTTMNVQHLESLNDQVWQITGVRVRETIPDWVVNDADEVVMVDVTPRALLNRLERGVVYSPEKAQKAMENFFRESTLRALRELALRQTAHEVEARQAEYPEAGPAPRERESAGPRERILIHVTAEPSAAALIRRGKRVADYLNAECLAVCTERRLSKAQQEALDRHLNFARNLHIETRVLERSDTAESLVEFARLNGVTQIFVAWPSRGATSRLFQRNLVQKIVSLAAGLDVTVVAERRPAENQR